MIDTKILSEIMEVIFDKIIFSDSESHLHNLLKSPDLNVFLHVHSTQSHCHLDLKVNPLVHVSNMQ